MTSRRRVVTVLSLFVLAGSAVLAAQADPAWLRMWTKAQADRPDVLHATGRIAPATEPGTPLVVHGRVFNPDGTTPAAGVVVFAYHTDRNGQYFDGVSAGAPWRLKGWVRTDAAGGFEFRTVRPGPYPGRQEPAHIHMYVDSPIYGRQWTQPLHFADDPLVTAGERQQSARAGRFGTVCPVQVEDGVEHIEFFVRLKRTPDY